MLWVTHDLPQAHRLADHTVVLVDGLLAGPDQAAAYLRSDGEREADSVDGG